MSKQRRRGRLRQPTVQYIHDSPTYRHEDDYDEDLDLQYEVASYEPQMIARFKNGDMIVGYLSHDEDASSPLEDADGQGEIIDARSRHGGSEAERRIRRLLNLAEWEDVPLDPDEEADPMCILLDVYEHSNTVWSVASSRTFPDQDFDLSRNAGLWVPDDCARENIAYSAVKSLLPKGVEVSYHSYYRNKRRDENGYVKYLIQKVIDERRTNIIRYNLPDGRWREGFQNFHEAILAAADALQFRLEPAAVRDAVRSAAVDYVTGIIDEYNRWLSGDCYGVVVEHFNALGEQTNIDACWGFIGSEYALDQMKSDVCCDVDGMIERGGVLVSLSTELEEKWNAHVVARKARK